MAANFQFGVEYVIARHGGLDPQAAEAVAHAWQCVNDATTRRLIRFAGGEAFELSPSLDASIPGHRVGGHRYPRGDASATARLDGLSQAQHSGERRMRGELHRRPKVGRCIPRAVVTCWPWTGNRGSAGPDGARRVKSVH